MRAVPIQHYAACWPEALHLAPIPAPVEWRRSGRVQQVVDARAILAHHPPEATPCPYRCWRVYIPRPTHLTARSDWTWSTCRSSGLPDSVLFMVRFWFVGGFQNLFRVCLVEFDLIDCA